MSDAIPPGKFRCDGCGMLADLGDEAEARAEAVANGFDPDQPMIQICDICYELFKQKRSEWDAERERELRGNRL